MLRTCKQQKNNVANIRARVLRRVSDPPSPSSAVRIPRLLWTCVFCSTAVAGLAAATARPPNILMFFCDNLGYGDIGPFGSTLHRTPNLDRLATQARKFTHFYTAANVCTPSRAGLMTGIHPRRLNFFELQKKTFPSG